ncbi:MAG: ECF-type sigma factor [Planctomycetota bacterium]|jgi:RNA polymerase sigma factor (TIGR02999 family)
MGEISRILSAIGQGDDRASEQLMPLVYDELRKLAVHRLARERPGQTLQATGLVHEAYIRLVDSPGNGNEWNSRGHFFGAAAEAMRRILIDRARKKQRIKHGGDRRRVDLSGAFPANEDTPDALLAIDEALEKLERDFPDKAQLVKLRHYAGCSLQEAADVMGISASTAKRKWAFARAFLYNELMDA